MPIMNWSQLMSTVRFRPNENGEIQMPTPKADKQTDPFRSDFHVDYDRLVFSNAFRRLGRKTQVHPLARNDHTHNRLTHSVEVSSVGRSLGNKVGGMLAINGKLPEHISPADLGMVVQVACLAHDLGNPPFGHTGEDALRTWFRQPEHAVYLTSLNEAQRNDVQTYEGNAHSLRQVVNLKMYRHRGGMRLTAASIGALLKYPWTSTHPNGRTKFNVYQTELPYLRHVAAELGLPEIAPNTWARHPLSYLMEAADDICYALMDLEDAIDLGLLDYREVENIMSHLVSTEITWQAHNTQERTAMMRGLAIGRAIDDVAQTFMRHHNDLLDGQFKGKDLLDLCSEDVQTTLAEAKKLARERIYRHRSKLIHELAAFPCLASMLNLLVPAAHAFLSGQNVSTQQSLALDLLDSNPILPSDSLYQAYMKILDYIGGMTDNYAAQTARELSGVGMVS
ncbi:MAG: deoxyguanosinetriphosphate triphosphohydrolase [Alysiella sp.]|uniref:deoxyguanosinetriphosphate triphosphohydrolase n=1 Tax=Alysiella sp. TaxID=1872483 RepID=UPI0026DC089B|nr:deoxyguanosinetriphosphate triphosphohydrolase [Alysiella sp.]MDO4433705.1 deoxyguanosinetriphosphate triphosphohydrolase [Alysiella sp.]